MDFSCSVRKENRGREEGEEEGNEGGREGERGQRKLTLVVRFLKLCSWAPCGGWASEGHTHTNCHSAFRWLHSLTPQIRSSSNHWANVPGPQTSLGQ